MKVVEQLVLGEECVLRTLRVKFSKGEEVKYISHLDTLRTFERAIRRANIPIAYSHGFNPRPQLSFGLPLSVGVTSETEYVDLEMEEEIPPQEFMQKLNDNMPSGFRILEAKYISSTESLMASIKVASYEIEVRSSEEVKMDDLSECIRLLLNKNSVIVQKATKDKVKEVDIRPYIYNIEVVENNKGNVKMNFVLSAGNIFNLKPELVIRALKQVCQVDMKITKIHRTGLYGANGTKLL